MNALFAAVSPWKVVETVVSLMIFGAIAVWLGFRALKRAEDPPRLIFKWILTAVMVWVTLRKVGPVMLSNPFIGVPATAACGIVFAIIWRHSIAGIISKPFENLYSGGDVEIEQRPFYSIAQAKRKRGHYDEAIAEIHKQLERFPDDFDGQLMLAEIQAENLNDLPAAQLTIERICHQPGHPPGSIALALNYLADWHLKYSQDREAARQALERISDLLPDTDLSAIAAQRIAHLATTEHLIAYHDRKRLAVRPGVENIGLLSSDQQPKAPEADPAKQTAEYVRHLEEHPLDTEVREKLARLYAEHYGRLDLATDQLEQLIAHPKQPSKRVVHWLNVLADLQVRYSGDYETVRHTVQRIIELFPNSAAAETAQSRLNHLKLELKGRTQTQTVKLGTYEQDIGLKRGLPSQF